MTSSDVTSPLVTATIGGRSTPQIPQALFGNHKNFLVVVLPFRPIYHNQYNHLAGLLRPEEILIMDFYQDKIKGGGRNICAPQYSPLKPIGNRPIVGHFYNLKCPIIHSVAMAAAIIHSLNVNGHNMQHSVHSQMSQNI